MTPAGMSGAAVVAISGLAVAAALALVFTRNPKTKRRSKKRT